MKKTILILPLALWLTHSGHTQIVGTDVFLKGNFVEVGIDGTGGFEGAAWNSASPPLAGMHYRSNTPYFGFVANPQMDGWVNFDGDFFTPGTPENGWGIEIIDAGGTIDIIASNNNAGSSTSGSFTSMILGSITGYTNTGGLKTATWQGNYTSPPYNIDITIVYSLYDTALNYTTEVSINNLGDPIDELYYYRNIDPDHNVSITGDYSTTNTILSQPSPSSNLAAVKAEQSLPWYSSYTLSSNDSTCRVSYGGFSNRSAVQIWHAGSGFTATPLATQLGDVAISLAARMDSVVFLRSARIISFTSSFDGSLSTTGINDLENSSASIYPNPTTGILNIFSAETIEHVSVYNNVGVLQLQAEGNASVDLSALSPGMYIVKVQTAKGTVTQKILKQ